MDISNWRKKKLMHNYGKDIFRLMERLGREDGDENTYLGS